MVEQASMEEVAMMNCMLMKEKLEKKEGREKTNYYFGTYHCIRPDGSETSMVLCHCPNSMYNQAGYRCQLKSSCREICCEDC